LRIVTEGSYHKFVNSLLEKEDLKTLLLETGDRELVEVSPYERIWDVWFGVWGEGLLRVMGSRTSSPYFGLASFLK